MPKDHLFLVPGQVLWTTPRSSYGVSHQIIVTNFFMENFENKTINTAEHPSRIWKRYVDDTSVIIDAKTKQGFLEHIKSVDPHINFTTENARTDGSIPFLDTIVMPQPDGSLLTSAYRKPTHTHQYLHWNSHYHLSAKI